MDLEELSVEQMTALKAECRPLVATSNFDVICRIVVRAFSMLLDHAIAQKAPK